MFDFVYITPSELLKEYPDAGTLEGLCALANAEESTCCNCSNSVWKYGQTDMCFSCVTGETDASEDYELTPELYNPKKESTMIQEHDEIPTTPGVADTPEIFILWNPKSDKPPKKQFTSLAAAEKTGLWASRQNPGESFFVCKLVNCALNDKLQS